MSITTAFKRASAFISAAAMTAAFTAAFAWTPFTAKADLTNDRVNADKSGILQVEVHYKPNGMDDITVQTGSGFLINDTTILTCSHVIEVDGETQRAINDYYSQKYSEEHKYDADYVQVKIAILDDVKEDVTVYKGSSHSDYAILTLDTTLQTKTPLILGDSDEIQQTQEVYALGFPSIVTDWQNHTSYTAFTPEDVTVTMGTVSKTGYVEAFGNTKKIQHNANLSSGNSGGPLVDSNGYVMGINQSEYEGFFYSIEINQVKELLDILGISYPTPGPHQEPTTGDNPEPITQPETIPPITDPVPPITTTNSEGGGGGGGGNNNVNIPLIIGIIVAVIAIIGLIVALLIKSSKKPQPPAPLNNITPPMSPPNPGSGYPVPPASYNPTDSGAGETSLLDSGAGETSVLNGGGVAVGRATLVRRKNGTSIPINAPEFIIGKENSKVNYCVNNSAVSRQHAKISINAGNYYITDLNSSNSTFINGRKIDANSPQLLNSGDVIKLADEEFEFRG